MVRCCHISRRLTHAVASIKTGFWRERKKERATTERQEWVTEWVSWGWAWAWSWSMIVVMIPSFSCAPSHCLYVCTCVCVCVSLVVGSAFFVKYVHWPLPNFQFFYYLFISWAALHTRTFTYHIQIAAYFCLLFNRLLRKQLRQQAGERGREVESAITAKEACGRQCSRKWPSTWFLIKFSSTNWNCQRLVAVVVVVAALTFSCVSFLMFPFLFLLFNSYSHTSQPTNTHTCPPFSQSFTQLYLNFVFFFCFNIYRIQIFFVLNSFHI